MLTFADVFSQPSEWGTNTTFLTTIFIVVLSIAILFAALGSFSDDKIHNLGGFHIITAWPFFSKRYDFLRENFKKTGLKMFCFNTPQVSLYVCIQCHKLRLTA